MTFKDATFQWSLRLRNLICGMFWDDGSHLEWLETTLEGLFDLTSYMTLDIWLTAGVWGPFSACKSPESGPWLHVNNNSILPLGHFIIYYLFSIVFLPWTIISYLYLSRTLLLKYLGFLLKIPPIGLNVEAVALSSADFENPEDQCPMTQSWYQISENWWVRIANRTVSCFSK